MADLGKGFAIAVHIGQHNVRLEAILFVDRYARGGFQQYERFMILGVGIETLEVFAPVVVAAIEMRGGEGRGRIVWKADANDV